MSEATQDPISLMSQGSIRPGFEKQVQEAVKKLPADIESKEPGTLTYLVHIPWADTGVLQSLPPPTAPSLLFFETYRDADAFKAHVQGTLFNEFVNQYGHCFIPSGPLPDDPSSKAGPYTTVQFLTRVAGFAHGRPREGS